MQTILILLIVIQIELIVLIYILLTKKKQTVQLASACFVDTSSLIDGRILDVAKAGFLPDHIVIPRTVLVELQYLADGSDTEKRSRARRGLDVVAELKSLPDLHVTILSDGKAIDGVDERLLELARKYAGSICTVDYNLNKVAKAESLRVLNINELAKNIRIHYLPGEHTDVLVAQKGNDSSQGVGYMPDGTMVVIDNAKQNIGSTISVEIVRSIQTDAGRMLFAKKHTERPVAKVDKPTKTAVSGRNKPSRKTKRTAEDTIVELANKEQ